MTVPSNTAQVRDRDKKALLVKLSATRSNKTPWQHPGLRVQKEVLSAAENVTATGSVSSTLYNNNYTALFKKTKKEGISR